MPKHIYKVLFATLLSSYLLTGCQIVSVKNQALNVTIANERESILTRNKLSEASLNVLSKHFSRGSKTVWKNKVF